MTLDNKCIARKEVDRLLKKLGTTRKEVLKHIEDNEIDS